MRKLFFVFFMGVIIFLPVLVYAQQTELGKKRITTIDDLPRHSYEVDGTVAELITSKETFTPFADRVRSDIKNDLETYQIEDKTTLRKLYGTLVVLDMLYGKYDAALKGIAIIRELKDKPAEKLMNGIVNKSIIFANREVEQENLTEYKEAFSRHLSLAIEKLPWEVIQERIEGGKGRMELYSENFLLGIVKGQIEPAVKQTHQISNDIATQVISIRFLIEVQLPLKDQIVEVYEKYIKANRVVKADIWKDRQVVLSEVQDLNPVVVAIWDTGVDTAVFPGRLFVNKKEKVDDKDNDGNGFIDDVHGIAYTLKDEKTAELLYLIEDVEERLPGMKAMMKGYFDLQAAIDSPEASALKQKIATMRPEEVTSFSEDLMQFVFYIHGTHVAGISVEGNPFARILVARLTADYHAIPLPPTVERAYKSATMYREVVAYFKAHGVRVVNMSWIGTLRGTESALEANGIGKDATERAKLARELFDIEKEAIYDAIQNAPEILFVNGAGNENDDVSFEDYFPTAFDLPNVLVAGAVDQAGDETSFTSFGKRVDVYANGFEVESSLPGGDKMALSGTSMSSPNVANLAAKLIALKPSLSPIEVVNLIKEGADQSEDGRLLLINPKHSVELLKFSKRTRAREQEIEDRESRTEEKEIDER